MNKKTRSRRGYAVIELLIGAATLSMAAAVIVPGMGQARSRSILAAERSNLRTIAQLMAKYSSEDPDGVLGPVHPLALNFIFEGYAEYGGGPGTMAYYGWTEQFDSRTRPLNHLLYGRNAIQVINLEGERAFFRDFQCLGNDRGWQKWPGFSTDSRETERPYFEANGTSFRMSNVQFQSSAATISNVSIYGRKKSRIPFPSQTLAFFEARVFQTLWTNEVWPHVTPGELAGYHGRLGYFNVVYADGRSDFVDFGNGTYYQHAIEYNELDVRGTWGQMDCFPDPALDANFGAIEPVTATATWEGKANPSPQLVQVNR